MKLKKFLSALLVQAMILALVPAVFAAEATTVLDETVELAKDATYETSWTAPADGTVTVAITSVDTGVRFWFGDNLPKNATSAKSFDFEVVGGTAYTFKLIGYADRDSCAVNVSFTLTFVLSGTEAPVEKDEYEISSTKLVLGDNDVTLIDSAVTTIYEFEPNETGVYTFTVPEDAVIGYWGAGSWFLSNPESTANTCQWTCTDVGQSAFVGVSGVEGTAKVNVAKTGEYVDTSIKYTEYVNTHTPNVKYTKCYNVDSRVSASAALTLGDDGFYYSGDKLVVVNFAASPISLSGMLGTGGAKYVAKDADGNVTEAVDYTNALLAYDGISGTYYPLTEDLYEMLPNITESKGWVESGYLSSWMDLCNTATVSHSAGEPEVDEFGTTRIYCTVCGALISEEGCAHDGLIHFEAIEPACHYTGNVEYWYCPDCEGFWTDEACTQVTNSKNVILSATGGEVVHVEAVEPGCHHDGNIEYWVCYECEQVWQDEALTQLTNIKNVVDPAPGHNYVDGVCTVCGDKLPVSGEDGKPGDNSMVEIVALTALVSLLAVVALPVMKKKLF